jgi:hypothetical protein
MESEDYNSEMAFMKSAGRNSNFHFGPSKP